MNPPVITERDILPLIDMAIKEDIGDGDVTSNAIFSEDDTSEAMIVAKQRGVFCGAEVARLVFRRLDPEVLLDVRKKDGEAIAPGEAALAVKGHTRAMLSAERTVLNFLQRMSGIATKTRAICDLLQGSAIRILDTRKTLPGFRLLDKYAVRMGGGENHRMGLFDMVMIKDNHIRAAGGITAAVKKIRESHGASYRIEVETTNIDEVREALAAGADIIMLDNMDIEAMRQAIEAIAGRAKTEISGNVDETTIQRLRNLRVDYISIGALTHSVAAFDLSMKFL